MRLPSLEPRHDQICSWSLTTQPSLQVVAQQQQQKILEVNLMLFFFNYFFNKKQLNIILFYLIKLFISYKEYKKIIIKILQRYSTLLQKLIINFNVFMVIILFY